MVIGMDIKKVEAYLRRIGLDDDVSSLKPDAALLRRLQYAHVTTVPYENLDILAGIPLKLDTDSLFDKIVLRGRGGYCFELNGLFGWLLRELGYETKDYMARYIHGSTEVPMRRHRVITAVTDEGEMLCDAGVGERSAKYPLLLSEGVIQRQGGETYRMERDPFYGWVVCALHKGEWYRQYGFTREPQLDIDYVMPSYYCEKHPDSIFNREYMLAIKTAGGRETLSGRVYRVFEGDNVTEREITDDGELYKLVGERFGLSIGNTDNH